MAFLNCFLIFSLEIVLALSAKTSYDENEAKKLFDLSAAAYSDLPERCIFKTMVKDENWTIVTGHNGFCDVLTNTCSHFVIKSAILKEIIIVFRGTKTKLQLLLEGGQSALSQKDFHSIGNVNQYFKYALAILWPKLEEVLLRSEFDYYKVTFTGHSLGGAIASLAALKTVLVGLRQSDQVKLVTFGQPRVGDWRLATKHNELVPMSFRVVNQKDIVPHLPPCNKDVTNHGSGHAPCDTNIDLDPYHHATEIWYPYGMNENDPYYECKDEPFGEDFNCSDKIRFNLNGFVDYLHDHRHYFSQKVAEYGKSGCIPST